LGGGTDQVNPRVRRVEISTAIEKSDLRIVYIAGMGRSGSTLLGQLLANQLGAFDVGELRFIWERGVLGNELCTCGAHFRECTFWTSVGEALGGWQAQDAEWAIDVVRRVQRIRTMRPVLQRRGLGDASTELDRYHDLLRRLYRAVSVASGRDIVVDTSKDARYGSVLCTTTDLDVRVLRLMRDSRAVAFSWARTRVRPETATLELVPRYGPAEAAGRYVVQSIAGDALAKSGMPSMRLRYEDLVKDVPSEISKIARWLDVDQRRPDDVTHQDHSMSGNPMRFGTHPAVVVADREWETEMSRGARATVTALTLPLLLQYGYLKRPSRSARENGGELTPYDPR
jgi:hypothetical protein